MLFRSGAGADAKAVAYVALSVDRGARAWGVGSHASIVTSSLSAVVSALNRARARAATAPARAAE